MKELDLLERFHLKIVVYRITVVKFGASRQVSKEYKKAVLSQR